MPKSIVLLCVCLAGAIASGIGRFVLNPSIPDAALDICFIGSTIAAVAVSIHIVAKALTRHAADEIDDIDRSRPGS